MNQKELQEKINAISDALSQKRSHIVREFRKKLEEKGVIYLQDKLNQK